MWEWSDIIIFGSGGGSGLLNGLFLPVAFDGCTELDFLKVSWKGIYCGYYPSSSAHDIILWN